MYCHMAGELAIGNLRIGLRIRYIIYHVRSLGQSDTWKGLLEEYLEEVATLQELVQRSPITSA